MPLRRGSMIAKKRKGVPRLCRGGAEGQGREHCILGGQWGARSAVEVISHDL